MRSSLLFCVAAALVACGGDDTSTVPDASAADASVNDGTSSQDGTSTDTSPAADVVIPGDATSSFVLTSSAFVEGAAIPVANSCKGVNESPPLAWTGAPGATKSFAVTLTDKTNGLVHWAMFDVAPGTTSLSAAIPNVPNPPAPAGSSQVKSYDNTTSGYKGPCPPNLHVYTFAVFALDVAALPNVSIASTRTQVVVEIGKHTLATATLTGSFTP
jgi:hypothetical protein